MPVQAISASFLTRHNGGTYGLTETFRVTFARSNVAVHAALCESYGPRSNKAGVASIGGDTPMSFGGEATWPPVAFAANCGSVFFGLSSSGNGGASGVFTVFHF
jgi:hypothetical protein